MDLRVSPCPSCRLAATRGRRPGVPGRGPEPRRPARRASRWRSPTTTPADSQIDHRPPGPSGLRRHDRGRRPARPSQHGETHLATARSPACEPAAGRSPPPPASGSTGSPRPTTPFGCKRVPILGRYPMLVIAVGSSPSIPKPPTCSSNWSPWTRWLARQRCFSAPRVARSHQRLMPRAASASRVDRLLHLSARVPMRANGAQQQCSS